MQSNVFFAIFLSFISVACCAGKQNPLFDLSLADLIDIPILGSTHSEENRESVPSAVTVFDRRQIEYLGVETLSQLVSLAPGFQVIRSDDTSGFSSLSARGRRTSGSTCDILLLVDGRRTLDYRVSSISTQLDMSLFNVERVEFIRGPGASLYGTGAMMGVINVITRKAANEIVAAAGNHSHQSYSLLFDHGALSAHLNYLASAGEHYSMTDMFTGEPIQARDPNENVQALFKLADDEFEAAFRYSAQSYNDFYALESLAPERAEFTLAFAEISLTAHRTIGAVRTTSSMVVGNSNTHASVRHSAPGALAEMSEPVSYDPYLADYEFEVQQMEFANQSIWDINPNNRFTFGGSYYQYNVIKDVTLANYAIIDLVDGKRLMRSSGQLDFVGAGYSVDEQTYYGLFGQWQTQPRNGSHITLGARLDYSPEIGTARLSPRVSWVEALNPNNSLKFIYGEAYRIPSIHERGIAESPYIIGNETLQAEVVKTAEILWVGRSQKWFWSLGVFNNHFNDSIGPRVTEQGSAIGSLQFVNTQYDAILGSELEIQWQPTRVLMLSGTATLIHENDRLAYQDSTELGSLTMNYGRNAWNLSLSAIYRGPRSSSIKDENDLDSYWLSLARFQLELKTNLRVFVQGSNLADDTVYYPTQSNRSYPGIPARGREILLGLNWRY